MFKKILQSLTIAMLCLPVTLEAQEQAHKDVPKYTYSATNPSSANRPYKVLLIRKRNNKVQAFNPASGSVVFKEGRQRRYPFEVIEWALHNASVTAVTEGKIKLYGTVNIPVSYTTLIIGPEAELIGPAEFYDYKKLRGNANIPSVIRNPGRDHVRIFNLGTVNTGGPKNRGFVLRFDGRNGGKIGINGGILFGTGETTNAQAGYWLVDSADVRVPLLWSKNFGNALLPIEGCENVEIGFIGALLTSSTGGEAETMDLNSHNKRTRINHIIGVFLENQDEILDINNSPNTRVDKVVGYGKTDKSADELMEEGGFVKIGKYGPSGRRMTQKPYIDNNSKGTEINHSSVVNKNVKKWETTVKTPGFPDNLPMLKINVRLKAVFEDGSTEQVFAKDYRFEL